MMRTLFLHPPSFEGFDGGAGSRYQARREIKRFWFPTWLAQPAALVEGRASWTRRRTARAWPRSRRWRATTTSRCCTPHALLRFRRQGGGAAESGEPVAQGRADRRQGGGAGRGEPRDAPVVDFVARNEFDFTVQEVAEGAISPRSRGCPGATARGAGPQRGAAGAGGHGLPALRLARLPPRPRLHEVHHRLPQAPLRLALYRPGLQEPLHLLPVAADSAGIATARARRDVIEAIRNKAEFPGSRRSSSTTRPSPTTRRAPRRSRASWASWGFPGPATRGPTSRAPP